ncbi:putative reverse transcriptase domain-containing protein [Tanacetum coccineum]
MWQGHTLQHLEIGNYTKDLNLCAPNEITTMMVHALQDATSETRLATLLVNYCPKLNNNNNNNNCGNQVGTGNAQAKVYAMGKARITPDANVVTGTFLLNNRYASVLFDTGADRSFVSTTFSSQINIAPTVLDHDYAIELADG